MSARLQREGPTSPCGQPPPLFIIMAAVYGASIMGQPCPKFFTFLLLYQTSSSFIRHLRGPAFQGQFCREGKGGTERLGSYLPQSMQKAAERGPELGHSAPLSVPWTTLWRGLHQNRLPQNLSVPTPKDQKITVLRSFPSFSQTRCLDSPLTRGTALRRVLREPGVLVGFLTRHQVHRPHPVGWAWENPECPLPSSRGWVPISPPHTKRLCGEGPTQSWASNEQVSHLGGP